MTEGTGMIRLFLLKGLLLTMGMIPTMSHASLDPDEGKKVTLSGYIKDASNGEALIGAVIYIEEIESGAVTNFYGYYSVTVAPGNYTLAYRYIGYQTVVKNLELSEDIRLDVELEAEGQELNEVVVSAEREDQNVTSIEMSVERVDIKTITNLPALMGENDVIKGIQLLPGVSTVGEGASGFNVRGGSVGQNLILLDEAPVYNSSHLFGFFSVFNPDAVKDVKLYKGVMPARFGGRLSSLLDVRMKDGNSKELHGSGGIGFIFSRFNLEGPLIKNKSSFIIAARRSYIDALLAPFYEQLDLPKGFGLRFSDLTLKTNFTVNENNTLFLSSYIGRDVFNFDQQQGFSWGNQTATLRWNHLFSDKLFLNTSFIYSNYDYELAFGDDEEDQFDWESNVETFNLKPQFDWYFNSDNNIRFGLDVNYYDFLPAEAVSISRSNRTDIKIDRKYALEYAAYLENEQKIGKRFKLNYGLRWSGFTRLGRDTVYNFRDLEPGERKEIIGFRSYQSGDRISFFDTFEPRLLVNFSIDDRSSIKLGFSRNAQYIHLVSNTTASNPLDVWTPSGPNISPQVGLQYSGGYFRNFRNNEFETSVEFYYKKSENQLDYIDGADLLLNKFLEGDLLVGEARAYGMELYFKKNRGRFNGWISYTLGKTETKTPEINRGDWYPARFDQRHSIKSVVFCELQKGLTFSATLTVLSGTPTTYPDGRIYQQGYAIPVNSEDRRNNVRIPWYHRLDFSFIKDIGSRKLFNWSYEGEFVFGAYNAYNRRNPFSIYFSQPTDLNKNFESGTPIPTDAYRVSIVGSIIPFVSYNFKF